MGCLYSKRRKEALRQNKAVTSQSKQKYLPSSTEENGQLLNNAVDNTPEFTEDQKHLVRESWSHLQEDMSKVGVVMFMNLFETHPDVQDVFMPFKGLTLEDLKDSSQLRAHALRVMGTVEKCLARLDETDKLIQMLHDLGSRHIMYTAKVDYIDLIGPQFIWAIAPVLGDKWTPEVEQAWSDLFKLVAYVMKNAMTF